VNEIDVIIDGECPISDHEKDKNEPESSDPDAKDLLTSSQTIVQPQKVLIEHEKNISDAVLKMIKDIFKKKADDRMLLTFEDFGVEDKN